MPEPFLLVQLSDPHIGATWGEGDPAEGWRAALAAVRRLPEPPDALLVTGDLTDNASDSEYALLRRALETVPAPAYVVPGNHDDRPGIRRHFALAGEPNDPVHYAADLGSLRLLALDTSKPGFVEGELGDMQLAWLEQELSAAPGATTLLAMHHPPFETGMPAWDEIGLVAADRAALADIVSRHPQVCGIVAGHVHRTMTARVASRVAMSIPSTFLQGQLTFEDTKLEFAPDPPGFAVHAVVDHGLVSYIHNYDRPSER